VPSALAYQSGAIPAENAAAKTHRAAMLTTLSSTVPVGSHAIAGSIVRCSQALVHVTITQAATPPMTARRELSVSS
jgi:hypothetical protein